MADFLDDLREYLHESQNNLVNDERSSMEFVEIYNLSKYSERQQSTEVSEQHDSKALSIADVGNWLRFEDKKPDIGQHYLLVWETYPPEIRIWKKGDIDKNWDTLRWLPIPEWK